MFTQELLQAVDNWQRGWRENQDRKKILAEELIAQVRHLPNEFKACDSVCYRQRFLSVEEMRDHYI